MKSLHRSQRYNLVFCQTLRLGGIFLVLMSALRFIFYFLSARSFEIIQQNIVLRAFFVGLRFDLLVVGFVFIPVVVLGTLWFMLGGREAIFKICLKVYLSVCWALVLISAALSLPHFLKEGRHFRWADPIYGPNLDLTSLVLVGLILLFMMASILKTLWLYFEYPYPQIMGAWKMAPALEVGLRLLIPVILVAMAARGTFGPHHLEREDSQISPWENVNELALNSVWCVSK